MQRREKKTSKVCVRSAPFVLGQPLLYTAPFTICSDLLTEHQELAKVFAFVHTGWFNHETEPPNLSLVIFPGAHKCKVEKDHPFSPSHHS